MPTPPRDTRPAIHFLRPQPLRRSRRRPAIPRLDHLMRERYGQDYRYRPLTSEQAAYILDRLASNTTPGGQS